MVWLCSLTTGSCLTCSSSYFILSPVHGSWECIQSYNWPLLQNLEIYLSKKCLFNLKPCHWVQEMKQPWFLSCSLLGHISVKWYIKQFLELSVVCLYQRLAEAHLHWFVSATDLLLSWNPVCLGLVEGVIGKIQLHTGRWRANHSVFLLKLFLQPAGVILNRFSFVNRMLLFCVFTGKNIVKCTMKCVYFVVTKFQR